MPTQNPLVGYFRLNRARLRRMYPTQQIETDSDLVRRLEGVIGEATFYRTLTDRVNPSAKVMYALTTLFNCRVEDLFDPVVGEVPSRRAQEARSA